jgi:hypothetical protein
MILLSSDFLIDSSLAPTARAHGWARLHQKHLLTNRRSIVKKQTVFTLLDTRTQLFRLSRTKSKLFRRLQEFASKAAQEIAVGIFIQT